MDRIIRPLHLYVHIPFVVSRSALCTKRVYIAGESEQRAYVHALVREMEAAAPDFKGRPVTSVCFGGGSPTALPDGLLPSVMRKIRELFLVAKDAEITVQESPARLVAAQMVSFQHLGVNRLEIGLVSGREKDCERLGLGFHLPASETALILAQMYGVKRYAAQLLFGLPGQTEAQFLTSVRFAVKFNTPEILLERFAQPGGESWMNLPASREALPDEAQIEEMLAHVRAHLAEKGYEEYLPLRFAKPGYESRQLLGKANGEDLLCFGPDTVSRTDGVTYSTTANLHAYMAAPDDPAALYTVHDRRID